MCATPFVIVCEKVGLRFGSLTNLSYICKQKLLYNDLKIYLYAQRCGLEYGIFVNNNEIDMKRTLVSLAILKILSHLGMLMKYLSFGLRLRITEIQSQYLMVEALNSLSYTVTLTTSLVH